MSKKIVITGVSRGLGRSMAEGFIAAGHKVAGCGRDEQAMDGLQKKYPSPHYFSVVDVSNADAVMQWNSTIDRDFGIPDLLINNAAIINKNAALWKVPAAEFDRLIDINIKGTANIIRAFLPAMIKNGSGIIVNFSSGWGRSTAPEVAPYCASKYAIEGLTSALAQELPAGMAAVALNPGVINTDMLQSCFGGSAHHYPTADEWAKKAVPFILKLGTKDNGLALSL